MTGALVGGAAVGLLLPIVLVNFTMGGSYANVHTVKVVVISAVCLAVSSQVCLQGTRGLGAVIAHIVGMVGGILSLLVLDAVWPRLALEQAEFAASYAPEIVFGAIRLETAFAVNEYSVAVAVALTFIVSVVQLSTYRPIAGRDPGDPGDPG